MTGAFERHMCADGTIQDQMLGKLKFVKLKCVTAVQVLCKKVDVSNIYNFRSC